jgi:hypothetical protein
VNAYKRKKNEWGVDGYDFPKFNSHMDKPRELKIVKTKKITYIDDVVK